MFSIVFNKGFHVEFENGYSVSVQFGGGNYCENRWLLGGGDYNLGDSVPESKTAETALMVGPDNDFVEYKGREVQGYQNAKDVLELLVYAESLPNSEDQAIIDIMGKSKEVLYTDEGTPIYFSVAKKEEN